MTSRLTWDEIERRYPDEWVLLDQPDLDEGYQVRGGRVVHHARDLDEIESLAARLRLKSNALLFTGAAVDPEVVFIL